VKRISRDWSEWNFTLHAAVYPFADDARRYRTASSDSILAES
jgi:hypothetical protein